MKRQPAEWEKMFAKHMYDQGPISKMCLPFLVLVISGCCWWLIRVDAAEMTPAQTFRCLRYKARLPGCGSRGTGEQDRSEQKKVLRKMTSWG